jgi:hypothetical protein
MEDYTSKTVIVRDGDGLFFNLAVAMSKHFGRVLYTTQTDEEYPDLTEHCLGDGFENIERCDNYLSYADEIDLFLFPGCGFFGEQELLRKMGKRVFGSGRGSEIEAYRTRFYKLLEQFGLDVPEYVVIRGVTALAKHLRPLENKWLKMNRFRRNFETCHWRSWAENYAMLDRLAVIFGPLKELVTFIVQDAIDDCLEIGGDFICINGRFLDYGISGIEVKNKAHAATLKPYSELPEEIRTVIEPFQQTLADAGYRNFLSTEQRCKEKLNCWTDFTGRLGFPSGNNQIRLYQNLPDLLWHGAEGEIVPVEFDETCAVEILFDACGKEMDWTSVKLPKEAVDFVNINAQCEVDGVLWSPPAGHNCDGVKTLGSISGTGHTLKEAVENAIEVCDMLSDLPIRILKDGVADLLKDTAEAQEEGIEVAKEPIPEPEEVVEL